MKRKILAVLLLIAVIVIAILLKDHKSSSDSGSGNPLPADTVNMKTSKPVIRIYMENSGSMNGYVTTNSEFKDALGRFIAKTNGYYEDTRLYFINDNIYQTDICKNLDDFVLNLNPETMHVGNTEYTDINDIFKMILARTSEDTVSVLVSDCVYAVQNAGNLLAAASSSTTGAFMKAIRKAQDKKKDFAVIIMKCSSKFVGRWYGGNKPFDANTERPYYIIIMGNKEQVADMNNHLELENTPTGIPGLKYKYMLSTESCWDLNEQTARVFTNGFTNAMRIKPAHDGLNIKRITVDKEKTSLRFAFGLGVDNLFADKTYLLDKKNYEVEPKGYVVADVTDQAKFTECDFFRHPICVQIKTNGQNFSPEITLRLKNKIPTWVMQSSYNQPLQGLPKSHKSYAIYEMIEGIYDAFYNARTGKEKDLFKMKVKIEDYD